MSSLASQIYRPPARALHDERQPRMLEVRHLTKMFGNFKAVDDLTFKLESGRIYAFVGPNGAGKTTTMRMIATLEEPTSGEIYVDGLSIYEHPYEIRRMLGYMPD